MKSQVILFIQGDWDGGHNGQYPKICELRESDSQNPISFTEGWGHGIGGGYFSFQKFIKDDLTETLHEEEALWLKQAMNFVVKNGFDHKKSCEFILTEAKKNQPTIPQSLAKHLNIKGITNH